MAMEKTKQDEAERTAQAAAGGASRGFASALIGRGAGPQGAPDAPDAPDAPGPQGLLHRFGPQAIADARHERQYGQQELLITVKDGEQPLADGSVFAEVQLQRDAELAKDSPDRWGTGADRGEMNEAYHPRVRLSAEQWAGIQEAGTEPAPTGDGQLTTLVKGDLEPAKEGTGWQLAEDGGFSATGNVADAQDPEAALLKQQMHTSAQNERMDRGLTPGQWDEHLADEATRDEMTSEHFQELDRGANAGNPFMQAAREQGDSREGGREAWEAEHRSGITQKDVDGRQLEDQKEALEQDFERFEGEGPARLPGVFGMVAKKEQFEAENREAISDHEDAVAEYSDRHVMPLLKRAAGMEPEAGKDSSGDGFGAVVGRLTGADSPAGIARANSSMAEQALREHRERLEAEEQAASESKRGIDGDRRERGIESRDAGLVERSEQGPDAGGPEY